MDRERIGLNWRWITVKLYWLCHMWMDDSNAMKRRVFLGALGGEKSNVLCMETDKRD